MNKFFLISLLLVLQNFILAQVTIHQKHALIIAIGNYPYESGWGFINSANDIPLIKSALFNQNFKPENILVLENEEADKNGIISAFENLFNRASKGDIIAIHYSGHGQQITDDNNDEIDGFDEALVAYGAPAYYDEDDNYQGGQHLRDDEFGELIDILRVKVGQNGQIVVFIDACHSGTGTRGEAKVRGGKAPFIIPGKNKIKSGKEDGSGMTEKSKNTKGEIKDKAPFIVMTATQFDELDYEIQDDEGRGVGPLSYAIAKVFTDIKENDSYLSVFARISAIMAKKVKNQTPTIEGDYNYKVFNGETVKQQNYYTISKKSSLTKIKLNQGNIHGLHNGDKVGLYKSGTQNTDKAEPEVTGIIIDADNFSSYVEFDKEFNLKYKNNYWVFIEEYHVKNKKLSVSIEGLKDADLKIKLTEAFDENQLVSIDTNKAELAIIEDKKKIIVKHIAEGSVLAELEKPVSFDLLNKTIRQYAQSGFIRDLSLNDENYRAETEMVPVIPAMDNDGELLTDAQDYFIIKDTLNIEDLMVNGKVHVGENDFIMLKIINTGKKDAYFNIIELQPDGVIWAVLPQEGSNTKELFVRAGQSIIPRNFIVAGFAPPYGTEMYKVFATAKPINLTPIITEQVSSTKGSMSDLEKVVLGSYGGTKGDKDSSIRKKDSGSTYEFTFIIKDKTIND